MRVLKVLLEPGSLSLLLLALVAGAVARRRGERLRQTSRLWIAAWCVLYLLLSLPVVARQLVRTLSSFPPLVSADAVPPDVPVVLLAGGGAIYTFGAESVALMNSVTTLRVIEAARVQRLLGASLVIAAGTYAGDRGPNGLMPRAMYTGLVGAGVPPERILLEAHSTTTYESAREVHSLLAERGGAAVVLVTSATHMTRAVQAFRKAGLMVYPAPTPALPAGTSSSWRRWVPSWSALTTSAAVLHEYVGLAYYALLGRV